MLSDLTGAMGLAGIVTLGLDHLQLLDPHETDTKQGAPQGLCAKRTQQSSEMGGYLLVVVRAGERRLGLTWLVQPTSLSLSHAARTLAGK